MLEFLFDATDISAFTTFYVSVFLSLFVKYFFTWCIDVSIDTITEQSSVKTQSSCNAYQIKSRSNENNLLLWIIKYIRKKESPDDEGEHFNFSY